MTFYSMGKDTNASFKDYSQTYGNYIFKIQLEYFYSLISTLRKKCLYSELFSFAFSRIWTEYGKMRRSDCGKMRTRITPNTNTFHAVVDMVSPLFLLNIKPK